MWSSPVLWSSYVEWMQCLPHFTLTVQIVESFNTSIAIDWFCNRMSSMMLKNIWSTRLCSALLKCLFCNVYFYFAMLCQCCAMFCNAKEEDQVHSRMSRQDGRLQLLWERTAERFKSSSLKKASYPVQFAFKTSENWNAKEQISFLKETSGKILK